MRILPIILLGLTLFNCDALPDVEPPIIEIISPEEGAPYFTTISIKLEVSDNSEVDRVEVFLDNQSVHIFTREPFVMELDISEFEEKPIMLRVVVYDQAGNVAEAQRHILHSHGLKIVSPNGGEEWPEQSTQIITWERCGAVGNYVSLYYSLDEGSGWTQIVSSIPNDGFYLWTLPAISEIQTSSRVMVSCTDDSHSDTSDYNFAITHWSPVLVGSTNTPGYPISVSVSGSYAYVTEGYGGLQIIDVSNPASPIPVGSYITPSERTWGVFFSGGYAYLADGVHGLQIIDVFDPANPTLTGIYNTSGTARGVIVSGDYAYLADGNAGLQIIDASDPANPTLTGTYDTPGTAYGVFVSGNYAYLADGNAGLQIINASDPANPILIESINTSGTAMDVFVSGNYAYLAAGTPNLQIIDVSNPASPTLVGVYNAPRTTMDGDTLRTGMDVFVSVFVSGNYAYVTARKTGLLIIDVSNPASLTLAGSLHITAGAPMDVFISSNYAYVADHRKRFRIYDFSGLP